MNINLTLIAQVVTFALFLWFTARFVWPPLTRAIADRQARIADGLEAAERGKRELELAQKKAVQILQDARADAADVIGQGARHATELVDQAKGQARAEGERLIASAQIEIEQMVNRAREQLRSEASAAAIAAAGKILEREIDPKTHQKLLSDLVRQI